MDGQITEVVASPNDVASGTTVTAMTLEKFDVACYSHEDPPLRFIRNNDPKFLLRDISNYFILAPYNLFVCMGPAAREERSPPQPPSRPTFPRRAKELH